ncbi:MAG: NHL repeat-containing protein [Planctomycetota bacterium]|jgi:DNA-binding beta-propeller fold protein YncE
MNAETRGMSGLMQRTVTISLVVMVTFTAITGCGGPTRYKAGSGSQEIYSFWPPLPNEPRIQYLTSYAYSSDVEPPQSGFDKLVFGTEREILPIGKPYGVAVWRGRIYVCDIVNPNVVILDLKEEQTRLMFTRRGEPMRQPTDITIAPDGMKYVADRRVGRIFVFDAEDRHVLTLGKTGLIPVGVAVHGDELYVPDFETQTVLVLDRHRGETLRSIGAPGGGPGQFIRPLGIDVDAQGNVFVTDAIRGRLQKFDPDGELIYALGEITDAPGNFVRPKHVTVDRDGVVYVVDAAFQNVQMFNSDGELLMYFGSAGAHAGSMSLPAGVTAHDGDLRLFEEYVHPAFEPTRLVLVTNQFGLHKVAVYALGGLRDGATIDDIAPDAATIDTGLTDKETTPTPLPQDATPAPAEEDAAPEAAPETGGG